MNETTTTTINEVIENVATIATITTIGEYEVLVHMTPEQARKVLDNVPNSEKAILDPQNDNFYIDPRNRYSQIAWWDGENDTLIIGQ